MPKPIPKKASPIFHSRPYKLEVETVEKLLTCLGYPDYNLLQEALDHQMPGLQVKKSESGAPLILEPKPSKATGQAPMDLGMVIRDIELALGLYVYSPQHLDEIPRAADYRETFMALHGQAARLLGSLGGLGGYYRDQFELKGQSIHTIEQSLCSLLGVCEAVQNDMKGKTSKGTTIERARTVTITQLLSLYREHAKAPNISGEADFVKTALMETKKIVPHAVQFKVFNGKKVVDIPEQQRLIEFDKEIKRLIRHADKAKIEMPRRF